MRVALACISVALVMALVLGWRHRRDTIEVVRLEPLPIPDPLDQISDWNEAVIAIPPARMSPINWPETRQ